MKQDEIKKKAELIKKLRSTIRLKTPAPKVIKSKKTYSRLNKKRIEEDAGLYEKN